MMVVFQRMPWSIFYSQHIADAADDDDDDDDNDD